MLPRWWIWNFNLSNGLYQTQFIGNQFINSVTSLGGTLININSDVAAHDLAIIDNIFSGVDYAVIITDSTATGINRATAFIGNNFLGTGLNLTTDSVPTMLNISYNTFANLQDMALNMSVSGTSMAFNMFHNLMDNVGFTSEVDATSINGTSATLNVAIEENFFLRSFLSSISFSSDTSAKVVIASNTFKENGNIFIPTLDIVAQGGNNCAQVLNNTFIDNFGDFRAVGMGGNFCLSLVGNYAPSWGYLLNNTSATFYGITPTFSENVGQFSQAGTINTLDFNSCCPLP